MWNEGAKAGLVLATVSIIYLFTSQFLTKAELPAILTSLISMILWLAKFGGCIWLMMFFMKKFAAENDSADNRSTRRLGMIISLLSAFVYASFTYINIAFISADTMAEQMDLVMQQMTPAMDSNTLSEVDSMLQNLPMIIFVTNFIYCFIYGCILSAILSRNIPSQDPFADYKPDEQ